MTAIASWLLGSRTGRWIALALLLAAAAAAAAWMLVAHGEARQRARQLAQSLNALRERISTDDDLARLSPDERRRRLARDWGLPEDR